MNCLIAGKGFAMRTLVAGVLLVSVLASTSIAAQPAPPGRPQFTPEQRRDAWQRMTPEQREQWRNTRPGGDRRGSAPLPPDSRPDMRGQVTPDERQAMRQRFLDLQKGRSPYVQDNAPSRRQLSPEERQQLRQQIEQARDQYRRGNGGNGNRGPNK